MGGLQCKYWFYIGVWMLVLESGLCEVSTDYYVTEAGVNSTELSCNVNNSAVSIWLFRKTGQNDWKTITQGGLVYSQLETKFALRIHSERYTLTVLQVNEEADGLYACQEGSTTKALANLTVEVPPVLKLVSNNITITDMFDVVFKKEMLIHCVSEEGKPSVSLSWEVNDLEETAGSSIDTSREDERIVESTLQYIPNLDDTHLACVTSGQSVVPSKRVETRLNVMFKPICKMIVTNETSNMFRLVCSCEANPKVEKLGIYVNGTLYSTKSDTTLPSHSPANVSCIAGNYIGTSETDVEELVPFNVEQPDTVSRKTVTIILAVVIPAVVILFLVAVTLVVRARKTQMEAHRNLQVQSMNLLYVERSIKANKIPLPVDDDGPSSKPESEKMIIELGGIEDNAEDETKKGSDTEKISLNYTT